MANSTDLAFEVWLKRQHELGHERDWIRRNINAVERAYRDNPAADIGLPVRLRATPVGDRYAGL